jgi:hypothetical protein
MNSCIKIANCSGFYGDRFSAAKEMVEGGPIDVLTGDYLAELTMMILWKNKQSSKGGYARTFVSQMKQILKTIKEKNIKVVSNAGGLDPSGCAKEIQKLCDEFGVELKVCFIKGDDITSQIQFFLNSGIDFAHLDTKVPLKDSGYDPVVANVYLGGFSIARALELGADIVITGRVTDASLVVGPAAWYHGWSRYDYDKLAGAILAGHVIECGAQATGGNYSFFENVKLTHPGFPIAEIYQDGSSVITKHPQTDGEVSIGTVTSQLLYEVSDQYYFNPDATARLDTVKLEQIGKDRVRLYNVKGLAPPKNLKVSVNVFGGYKNSVEFVITGLNREKKAEVLKEAFLSSLDLSLIDELDVNFIDCARDDAITNELACSYLRITAKSKNEAGVSRNFSQKATELALANYPGFFMTSPPKDASTYAIFWPCLIPRNLIKLTICLNEKEYEFSEDFEADFIDLNYERPNYQAPLFQATDTKLLPLGTIIGARSGDKGGDANVGFFAKNQEAYAWLANYLTVEKIKELLLEAKDLKVQRTLLPNLLAVNFVIKGLLGQGVAASYRFDPQAKGLGEYLRSRYVEIPVSLLEQGD